ncbi:MAG: FecR domain-containing protein [Verrucomicrobiales bacterium]|nr:FecR domain-containing protein [Verrucomicrobiales bacterium]
MKDDEFTELDLLIERLRDGDLNGDEASALSERLKSDPDAQERFARQMMLSSGLHQRYSSELENVVPFPTGRAFPYKRVAAVAAMLIILAGVAGIVNQPKVIATLASSEDAAWQSDLPTRQGSDLTKGSLSLTSGIATIRFRSGAEMTLEGPAELALKSSMRARLISGAAMMNVPDSAIGFVLETPEGFAVDHGTQFAVNVDPAGNQSRFEVIDGEISVHLDATGEEARLKGERQSATISNHGLATFEAADEKAALQMPETIRLGTRGRATSVIANNRKKALLPDVIGAKKSENGKWDRRALMEFDLNVIDLTKVKTASLRLNQVPTTKGSATRLPKINHFGVYGLTNQTKANWELDCLWQDAPGPEDGILLGTFEIPRSQNRGSYIIDDPRLLEYIKKHAAKKITLILVRETGPIAGGMPGPVHSFAKDTHPEAAGPLLEFSVK